MPNKKKLPGFKYLQKRFVARHKKAAQKLIEAHRPAIDHVLKAGQPFKQLQTDTFKLLTASAISGALLLAPMNPLAKLNTPSENEIPKIEPQLKEEDIPDVEPDVVRKTLIVRQLDEILPSKVQKLNNVQREQVSRIVSQRLQVSASSNLNGHELNTDFGYIGAEQHLYRYPGDSIADHDEVRLAGIAPKKGAFGYFASSKSGLSEEIKLREKYYFAVQTFRAPGWHENVYQLKEWFKFRKVIAINTKTGDAVVGVIGDAGPAVWTGKQFGGSPETMVALHLEKGPRKGEVLLLFVDDPNNEIPLGPI